MIKVLIADDHRIVRDGLKQILADTSDIVVLDEAKNGGEVLEKVKKKDFDVIILDISMPGINGLDVLKHFKNSKLKVRILVLSMYPEGQYAVQCLRAGAYGYLTKENAASDQLISAIRQIFRGKKYINFSLAEMLVEDIDGNFAKMPHRALTDREFQVMCMIASGKTLREVAKERSLSKQTISTYRSRILRKLGLKSNAQLIHYAVKNGLV